jgi:hypothetical protein
MSNWSGVETGFATSDLLLSKPWAHYNATPCKKYQVNVGVLFPREQKIDCAEVFA